MNAKLLQSAPASQRLLRGAKRCVVLARRAAAAAHQNLFTMTKPVPLASDRGAASLILQLALGGATSAHHAR